MKAKQANNDLSEIEWTLIWMACRYAMNRQTIASATLPSLIIRHYHDRLSPNEKQSLCRDLKGNFERWGKLGDPRIDNRHWMKFWKCPDTESHIVVWRRGESITCFVVGERYYPLFKYLENPDAEIYLIDKDLEK